MIEKLFNYYSNNYKVDWLPNGDVVVYDKNIKQEEHIGFVIYFNKDYAITVDTEIIFILKKKKYIFTNKTYWKQINHIHMDEFNEEKVIEIVDERIR